MTCGYQVTWKRRPGGQTDKAPGVTILIPFSEQVEMTKACVAALRRHTRGVTSMTLFCWITDQGLGGSGKEFIAAQENLPATRVLRIAEPFNYSRINNLGAQTYLTKTICCL